MIGLFARRTAGRVGRGPAITLGQPAGWQGDPQADRVWSCSAQEASRSLMPAHRVRWVVEAGGVHAAFSCDGDRRSRCHLVCAQGCGAEQWPCGSGEDGLAHPMAEGTQCHVVLFLEQDSAEEFYAGPAASPRDGLVDVRWQQDFYIWHYAAQTADLPGVR
jgi:hypothetical protein